MFAFGLAIGNTMHKLEYFGVILYLLGVFLMLTDPFAIKVGGEGNQYLGDTLNIYAIDIIRWSKYIILIEYNFVTILSN